MIKPNAAKIEFVKGRIKFGKLDENGVFYIPKTKYMTKGGIVKWKSNSGTKDSMFVLFDPNDNNRPYLNNYL